MLISLLGIQFQPSNDQQMLSTTEPPPAPGTCRQRLLVHSQLLRNESHKTVLIKTLLGQSLKHIVS